LKIENFQRPLVARRESARGIENSIANCKLKIASCKIIGFKGSRIQVSGYRSQDEGIRLKVKS